MNLSMGACLSVTRQVADATPAQAAALEAFEEAGAEGKIASQPLGIYSYTKEIDGALLPCIVAVFALRVKTLHSSYPEQGQRQRQWLSRKKAAALIEIRELRHLIRDFQP